MASRDCRNWNSNSTTVSDLPRAPNCISSAGTAGLPTLGTHGPPKRPFKGKGQTNVTGFEDLSSERLSEQVRGSETRGLSDSAIAPGIPEGRAGPATMTELSVPRLLKEIRRRLGLTQEQLAHRIGVSRRRSRTPAQGARCCPGTQPSDWNGEAKHPRPPSHEDAGRRIS